MKELPPAPVTPALPPSSHETLESTWAPKPGAFGWIAAADHKAIGLRFIVTAFVFFIIGGIEAALIRLQLARPEATLLSAEAYNQIFTMHGTTMMFFFAVPIWAGFGLYLVPLMLGTREMPFPRMNAFSYWIFLFAGLSLYASVLLGAAPNSGWTAYPTLTRYENDPSVGIDLWATSITLLEFSALTNAVSLIVTILKHRAPGMGIHRMPIFVWAMLVYAFMIVFAMPSLLLSTIMLELDRSAFTQFFNPAKGGDPLLFQHLFWWFAHPEVYIIFLPGVGVIAQLLPSFTRREIVGYPLVVIAIIATGTMSFSVWAHHMFTVGLPKLGMGYFSAATIMIGIPTAVQIFAWLATVWSSHRLVWRPPFLFSIGFIVTFVFGGISGVALGSVPFNFQAHDTYFVVAHFHYVLIGGMVFPLMAALHFWYPKFTGRMLSDTLGRWTFALTFTGMNLAFFPMHVSGLLGMPRRVYTYPAGMGLEIPNLISTIGAVTFAAGIAVFLWNVVHASRGGTVEAGNDPWSADSLEWSVASPPPHYNFAIIPSVAGRSALWTHAELRRPTALPPGHARAAQPEPRVFVELREDRRETPVTSHSVGEIEARNIVSGPSVMPFLAALAATVGLIGPTINVWLLPVGILLGFVAIATWHWPEAKGGPAPILGGVPDTGTALHAAGPERPPLVVRAAQLPVCHTGGQAPLWWGMLLFILIEAVFFAALIVSYYYLRGMSFDWPPGKTPRPALLVPTIYTVVLLVSSYSMHKGDKAIAKGNTALLVRAQSFALFLAFVFLALKVYEYGALVPDKWYADAYESIKWTISTFHGAHVLSVVGKGLVVLALAKRGYFTPDRRLGVQINGIYWHFVVFLWLPLFFTLYIFPYLQ